MDTILKRKVIAFVICIAYYICRIHTQDACHPESGPEGFWCVNISGYDSYQVARCTTPDDVSALTNNTFRCADSCRNYCWLPCMAEEFGKGGGIVHKDCSCAKNTSWCSRNTTGCEFFTTCLMDKIDGECNTTVPSVTVSNGLCEKVTDLLNGEEENCTSKNWLREFRICLQGRFIAEVYLEDLMSCDINATGYNIVEGCLTGICDVSTSAAQKLNDTLFGTQLSTLSDQEGFNSIQQALNCSP